MKKIGLFAVLALTTLFASCDRNDGLPNDELSGKAVHVRIRSLGMATVSSADLTRSFAQKGHEMVSKPIGDGLFLDMIIEPDTSLLRLGSLEYLTEGTYFRVIAVEAGTTNYYSHGDFVVGGSTSLTSFYVHVGSDYDFICFSYHDNQPLPTPSYVSGDPLPTPFNVGNTKDLLWWKSPTSVTVTASGVELDIQLKQKLVKAKVIVDCNSDQWKITGVTANKVSVGEIAIDGTIDWATGNLTAGTAADRGLIWSDITPDGTQQTSDSIWIMPKTSGTITVKIQANAVSRSGLSTIPSGDRSVAFTTALNEGVRYTIRVRLRLTRWAKSNIYWEGNASAGYLTFEPADGSTGKEYYQGVFFRWMSYVGITPIAVNMGSTPAIVYVVGGSGWIPSKLSWNDIPYKTGDICTRINSAYRIPTSDEFGSGSWEASSGAAISGNDFGTTDVKNNGGAYLWNTTLGVSLPASGGISSSSNYSGSSAGERVYYWTATSGSTNGGLAFLSPGFQDININNNAFPIRCIKK
jgi:hypothetical protein